MSRSRSNAGEQSQVLKKPVEVVLLAAPSDAAKRVSLHAQLLPLETSGFIRIWHGGKIQEGDIRVNVRMEALAAAQLVLILLSAELLKDEEAAADLEIIFSRFRIGELALLPVRLRPVLLPDWLNAVPATPRKWITDYSPHDAGFHEAAQAVQRWLADRGIIAAELPVPLKVPPRKATAWGPWIAGIAAVLITSTLLFFWRQPPPPEVDCIQDYYIRLKPVAVERFEDVLRNVKNSWGLQELSYQENDCWIDARKKSSRAEVEKHGEVLRHVTFLLIVNRSASPVKRVEFQDSSRQIFTISNLKDGFGVLICYEQIFLDSRTIETKFTNGEVTCEGKTQDFTLNTPTEDAIWRTLSGSEGLGISQSGPPRY